MHYCDSCANQGSDGAPLKSLRAFLLTGMGAGSSPLQSFVFRTPHILLRPTNCKGSDPGILTMHFLKRPQPGLLFPPNSLPIFQSNVKFSFLPWFLAEGYILRSAPLGKWFLQSLVLYGMQYPAAFPPSPSEYKGSVKSSIFLKKEIIVLQNDGCLQLFHFTMTIHSAPLRFPTVRTFDFLFPPRDIGSIGADLISSSISDPTPLPFYY